MKKNRTFIKPIHFCEQENTNRKRSFVYIWNDKGGKKKKNRRKHNMLLDSFEKYDKIYTFALQ